MTVIAPVNEPNQGYVVYEDTRRASAGRRPAHWTASTRASAVTRSSSDHYFEDGALRKRRKPALTRGLNQNYNRRLKRVFKSVATSGSRQGPFKPFYERLLAKGLKPDLAKLTLARRIAAIALALWKKGERFDPKKLK